MKHHIPPLIVGLALTVQTALAQVVDIPDPELDAAIRLALDKPTGDISVADMESLTELDASSYTRWGGTVPAPPIDSLEGLQAAKHLDWLDLSGSYPFGQSPCGGSANLNTGDMSPLAPLTRLVRLDLMRNNLESLIWPEGLTNLTVLDLSVNSLTDFSVLTGLSNLQKLNLSCNQPTDLSFLSSLTSLQTLDLSYNEITGLALPEGLTNLTTLNLRSTQLTSLTLPEGLLNLATLDLRNNQLTDFHFLTGLSSLTTLDLSSGTGLTSLTLPEGLSKLTTLTLTHNQLTSLSLPEGLTNLTALGLNSNQLTSVALPTGLVNLTTLDLGRNQLKTLALPEGLTRLTRLDVRNNPIAYLAVPIWMDLDNLEILGFPKDQIAFHAGSIRIQANELSWTQGVLQFAPTPHGPWTDLPAAIPMPLSFVGERGFFQVKMEIR